MTPRDLDRRRVQSLIATAPASASLGARMRAISSNLIGCPYVVGPLVGSAREPEVFVAGTESFDCVTLIESVLALALSRNADDFVEFLRRVRYRGGHVDWHARNHYMTDWIANNAAAGIVTDLSPAMDPVLRRRNLSVLTGYPAKTVDVCCVPKRRFMAFEPELRDGDLIFFASTRRSLDIFHCGLLLGGSEVRLRHAARSRGAVVEEALDAFLARNRMAGCIVARPLDGHGKAA